jgi:acyl-CoA dehydrogenase
MNFDFSDDQRQLGDQARRVLDDHGGTAPARRALESAAGIDRELWSRIIDLGWLGVSIDEADGGLGLGRLELCVLAEELGRCLAPVPWSSSLYLAAEALHLAGSPAQRHERLGAIASGAAIGVFAAAEGRAAPTPASLATRFENGRLWGTKTPVADGLFGDFAIVLAQYGASATWVLVDLAAPEVARRPVGVIDPSRGHAEIVFDGAPAEVLGERGAGWLLTQALHERAAVPFAFEQLGGAQACLDAAVAWATQRQAFGRPIGAFQAVRHKLADLFVTIELARSHAYYGAWALQSGSPELPLAAAGARLAASEAFETAARESLHVMGGIGFTWEADAHIYLRRAKLLALNIGAPRTWREHLMLALDAQAEAA